MKRSEMYGQGDGSMGREGHKRLRAMVHDPSALAAGQDSLRQALNITKVSGGAGNSALEHAELPHSHGNLKGSVCPSRPKK